VILKSYVDLTSGVSWHGKIERAWIAWHWETSHGKARSTTTNIDLTLRHHLHMYGCFLLDVWAGVSHWSAVHLSVVLIDICSMVSRKRQS